MTPQQITAELERIGTHGFVINRSDHRRALLIKGDGTNAYLVRALSSVTPNERRAYMGSLKSRLT